MKHNCKFLARKVTSDIALNDWSLSITLDNIKDISSDKAIPNVPLNVSDLSYELFVHLSDVSCSVELLNPKGS